VRRFVRQPPFHMIREGSLRKRLLGKRLEFGANRRSIHGGRLFGRHSGERLALYKAALRRIQRRKRIMPRLQQLQLG